MAIWMNSYQFFSVKSVWVNGAGANPYICNLKSFTKEA